ncbi:hypothetical protein F4810DRAFT_660946 [Camillea tinctor]|nr:hypothetical protein F4810DRAFT_660946 [Camillea tinctor]
MYVPTTFLTLASSASFSLYSPTPLPSAANTPVPVYSSSLLSEPQPSILPSQVSTSIISAPVYPSVLPSDPQTSILAPQVSSSIIYSPVYSADLPSQASSSTLISPGTGVATGSVALQSSATGLPSETAFYPTSSSTFVVPTYAPTYAKRNGSDW